MQLVSSVKYRVALPWPSGLGVGVEWGVGAPSNMEIKRFCVHTWACSDQLDLCTGVVFIYRFSLVSSSNSLYLCYTKLQQMLNQIISHHVQFISSCIGSKTIPTRLHPRAEALTAHLSLITFFASRKCVFWINGERAKNRTYLEDCGLLLGGPDTCAGVASPFKPSS